MTRSSSSSSTWMLLLLLLPLFITFHHSLPTELFQDLEEFNTNINSFGHIVMNCSESCDSAHITDERCRCLNYSVSKGECGFPGYFTEGLNLLHPSISKYEFIQHLILRLDYMSDFILKNVSFCSQPMTVLSPKCLHKKLNHLKEYINSNSINGLIRPSEDMKVDCPKAV